MITGMMRVKNEMRWLPRVVERLRACCDEVIVLDDHSTDGTTEWLSENVDRVLIGPVNADEVFSKNVLLGEVLNACDPSHIVCIDGDEEFAPGAAELVRAVLTGDSPALAYSLPVRYLWNDASTVRVDGVYRRFARPSIFAPQPGVWFEGTDSGNNFHCSNVPAALWHEAVRIEAPLLHYGYMYVEDRVRKYEWYNSVDPHNYKEDCYRHMVVGDLYEAASKFRHGGPLELEAI